MRAFAFTGVSHGLFCVIFCFRRPITPTPRGNLRRLVARPVPRQPHSDRARPVFRVPCPRKDRSPGTLLAAEKAKQAALKRPAQKRLLFAEGQQEDGRRAVPAVAEGEGEEQVI